MPGQKSWRFSGSDRCEAFCPLPGGGKGGRLLFFVSSQPAFDGSCDDWWGTRMGNRGGAEESHFV